MGRAIGMVELSSIARGITSGAGKGTAGAVHYQFCDGQ